MTDFEKYIQRYLNLVLSENWIEELKISGKQTLEIYEKLSEEQGNFAYAEGKWSLKTLLQHLIDTEKVFAYRAMRFSRKDQSLVSGFDEEAWADNSYSETRTLKSLIKEFKVTRKQSSIFFKTLPIKLKASAGSVLKKIDDCFLVTLNSLIKLFKVTRKQSSIFFKTLPAEALSLIGIVNGNEIKVETIGKLTVGHNIHHLNVIKERYLPNL